MAVLRSRDMAVVIYALFAAGEFKETRLHPAIMGHKIGVCYVNVCRGKGNVC